MINIDKITSVSLYEWNKVRYCKKERFFFFWTMIEEGYYIGNKKLSEDEALNYIPETIMRIQTVDGGHHEISFKSKELANKFFNKELKNKINWIYDS